MAVTREKLEAIEDAYYQGVLSLEYGDKKLTYRSAEKMKQIINEMRRSLGLSTGSTRKYYETGKGLS